MHALTLIVAPALCALLAGCGSQTPPTSATDPSSGTTEGGAGADPDVPPAYRFVLTSSCGERGLLGDYGVTVRDDRVTAVENLNEGYPYQPRLAEIPTLTDLAALGQSGPEGGVVDYVEDEDGVPRSVTLDPMPNADDDEECYVVSGLERLGDGLEPQPADGTTRRPVAAHGGPVEGRRRTLKVQSPG